MADPYSDFDVLPELAKNSKTLMRLEEYVHYVIEATQYWQESRYMVKNEIREIFSSISSVLHQREMQLYQQVDALVNHINYHNAAVDMVRSNCSAPVKNSSNSNARKLFSSGSYVSPPLKLKFEANTESLEEAIRSFGCTEIQDDSVSDDNNFVFLNSSEDDINMKADHVSLHGIDLDQNDSHSKIEISSVVSSNSSDSFEILSDSKASAPLPRSNNDLMSTSEEAEQAIKALNNFEFRGSRLLVEGVKLTHTGSLNLDSAIKMADANESSGWVPCSATSNEIPDSQWLRKSDSPSTGLSPAAVLSRNLASMLSSNNTPNMKVKQAPTPVGCSSDPNPVVSDLSNHLKSTVICDKGQNYATGDGVADDTAESGIQDSPMDESSQSSVPEFNFIIKKMFGSGNDNWLNRRGSVSSDYSAKTAAELTKQKNRLLLNRIVLQKEGSLLVHVNSAEKSRPAFSIQKMFDPYFKTLNNSNWLVKNRSQKNSVCS